MITTLLIDDEPLAIQVVKNYLKAYPEIQVVAECNNGFEAFKAIQEHQPQLIFLDIQMPKITGFELLELLENPPAVIFTTAFDEYALKAFDQQAVDYLLKPFSKARFDQAMLKVPLLLAQENRQAKTQDLLEKLPQEEQNRVVVKVGSNIKIIPTNDIYYLEGYDDYVKIHTQDDTFLKKQTLHQFENSLPDAQFIRVHRSYLVQLKQITKIDNSVKDSHQAILTNGVAVPLSRSGYARLKSALGI